ncbi:MAG: hypothetical protein LBJ09_02270 [Clostridiales bacterium]|jgi:hypothetical protein|nr:hypothetical protein [Clostridiales bacterium]
MFRKYLRYAASGLIVHDGEQSLENIESEISRLKEVRNRYEVIFSMLNDTMLKIRQDFVIFRNAANVKFEEFYHKFFFDICKIKESIEIFGEKNPGWDNVDNIVWFFEKYLAEIHESIVSGNIPIKSRFHFFLEKFSDETEGLIFLTNPSFIHLVLFDAFFALNYNYLSIKLSNFKFSFDRLKELEKEFDLPETLLEEFTMAVSPVYNEFKYFLDQKSIEIIEKIKKNSVFKTIIEDKNFFLSEKDYIDFIFEVLWYSFGHEKSVLELLSLSKIDEYKISKLGEFYRRMFPIFEETLFGSDVLNFIRDFFGEAESKERDRSKLFIMETDATTSSFKAAKNKVLYLLESIAQKNSQIEKMIAELEALKLQYDEISKVKVDKKISECREQAFLDTRLFGSGVCYTEQGLPIFENLPILKDRDFFIELPNL